jgi:hypothetical protein
MKKLFIFNWKATFLSVFVIFNFTNWVIAQTVDEGVDLSSLTEQGIVLSRIQKLSEELEQMKAEIAQAQTRLMQLKSQMKSSEIESKISIRAKSGLASSYHLLESIYRIDGREIAKLSAEDGKSSIYDGLIPEGKHEIEVEKLYERKSASLSADSQTFRLKNSVVVTTVLGKTVYVDAVVLQKDKGPEEKLAIRFDVHVLPNEKSTKGPVSILQTPSLKKKNLSQETYLTIVVKESMNPELVLKKQTVFIDKQLVETITPSLVTEKGQVIFDSAVNSGRHAIKSVLEYEVSGDLAVLLKTKKMKLKFSDQFFTKPGHNTLYLKGYKDEARVVLSGKDRKYLTEIKKELLKEQQSTVEPKQVSGHG